jgi:hypothetical protein
VLPPEEQLGPGSELAPVAIHSLMIERSDADSLGPEGGIAPLAAIW